MDIGMLGFAASLALAAIGSALGMGAAGMAAVGLELKGFALLRRGNRLSVMPVAKPHWTFILSLLS